MEKKGKKERKSGSSFCFGKSLTMRLPRSKSREKLRMAHSKSSDRLDRKSSSHCEGMSDYCEKSEKSDGKNFKSCSFSEYDIRGSCSSRGNMKGQGELRRPSLERVQSETSVHHKVIPRESPRTVVYKKVADCKLDTCSNMGLELGPRKEPSAPVLDLNDDSVYTSRQGIVFTHIHVIWLEVMGLPELQIRGT